MTSGVVLLDKPKGWTSRRAVDEVARLFAARRRAPKAGHGGTLDPLATGMLPILLGEATRLAELGIDADKHYRCSIDFSLQTDSLDADGRVLARFPQACALSEAALRDAMARFRGEIEQVPPAFSAVKLGGRPAYARARAGEALAMPPRRVRIDRLELIEWTPPVATIEVVCSKGTFVRSLARDLGATLGLGGCVVALRRLSTAGWPPEAMRPFEAVARDPAAALLPLEAWVAGLPVVRLDAGDARRFAHGQRLPGFAPQRRCAVFFGDRLLGLAEVDARGVLRPRMVRASARAIVGR